MSPALLDAALGYAARNWRVHPLHHPTITEKGARCSCPRGYGCPEKQKGKHPRLGEWPEQATTDPETIRAWWKKWPHANIGIVTGPGSRLAVLDIDPRNGGDLTLAHLTAQHGALPDTPIVLSGGGGQHYDFALEDDLPSLKLEGIDFLTAGHYVIAPPSLHPSGQRYAWELSSEPDDVPLAPIPAWLRTLVETTAQAYTVAASTLPDDLPSVDLETLRISTTIKTVITLGNKRKEPYPSRSEALFAVETSLIRAGYDDATIAAILLNPQYGISDKPLHQKDPRAAQYWTLTKGWIARDIARARAKVEATERQASTGKAAREAPRMWQNHTNGPAPSDADTHTTAPPRDTSFTTLFAQTDHGNADALGRNYGLRLRYCYEWKHWLWWTEHAWTRATREVMAAAQTTIKRLTRQVETMHDRDEITALLRHIKSSLSTTRLKAMIEQAQAFPGIAVTPDQLDAHPWLLNTLTGTLELDTLTLREHRRDDLLTKCLAIPYDPEATCPTWEAFLWRIMGGTPPDPAGEAELSAAQIMERQAADDRAQRLTTFLQRAVGYSLTGDTREQCLFLLHGSGDNGKSTFLETLHALCGAYAESTPAESFLARNRTDSVNNDIAKLRGARLVTAVEIGENTRLNEALVKRLTGQDTMTARFLFQEFFDFKPEFKLFLAFNHLPIIKDTGHAMWRRVKLIPFTITIPKAEQDPTLGAKLQHELPGILAWAVRGCRDWQREGLTEPQEVTAATQAYRTEMDTFGRFLEDECITKPFARVKASLLYRTYHEWCERHGEPTAPQRAFGMYLSEKGLERYTNNGHWWRGIGLQASSTDPTDPTDP